LPLSPPTAAAQAQIRHVFTIILENQSYSNTFGVGMPVPYLSQTLAKQGALLQNCLGAGRAAHPRTGPPRSRRRTHPRARDRRDATEQHRYLGTHDLFPIVEAIFIDR
jgi:hypothetical protein